MSTVTYLPATPIIVTGGASGIGKACAEALAQVGRPVAVWDLAADRASAIAEKIAQEYGVKSIGLAVDVADLAQVSSGVADTREALGPVGGLVHAAGVSGVASLEELTPEIWNTVLDINLRAQAFLIQAVLPDLKSQPGAAVVGISSMNATLGNMMNPAYSASKGGMLAMSRALADELAHSGIRINSVSPGVIATPMLLDGIEGVPGQREAFERRVLLGRLGEPEEVARAVRFLLSDEASYITAAELVVDGGNISSQRQ